MGVVYEASPLHRISFLVVDESAPSTTNPPAWWGLPPIPGAKYMTEPARFRSPAASEIIRWRDRLAVRYRAQLGERLTWDEASEYAVGEDAAVSADVMLRYVGRSSTSAVRMACAASSAPKSLRTGKSAARSTASSAATSPAGFRNYRWANITGCRSSAT